MLESPLLDLIRALQEGTISSVALTEAAIERHRTAGKKLNAYRTFAPEFARAAARQADLAFAAGRKLGPLQGIPTSVKDLYGVSGLPTYAGTPRRLPAKWDAEGPLVHKLREQLSVIVGKSHTVEFALGGLGTNQHYGSPYNPWDPDEQRISGGSSSGAGVSLLEGSALVAVGSDTTGSVRMPASFTGTVGLMVSHGRWSTDGIVPVAPILDAPGLLTRTVADLVPAFFAVEPSSPSFWDDVAQVGDRSLTGTRIGVPRQLFWDDCSPGIAEGVRAALAEIERRGAGLVELDLPHVSDVFQLFQEGHLSTAAVYGLIRTEFPQWWDGLDSNIRERLETYGAGLPAHEYVGRLRQILDWMRQAAEALAEIEAIAFPSVSVTPGRVADLAEAAAYRTHNVAASRNSAVIALLGLCALSMPVALDAAGMPVGLQLAAKHGGDVGLMGLALACERALGTSTERIGKPPLMSRF